MDFQRHILETGLTFLHHASIPLTFWSFAFEATVYLINRMPKVNLFMSSAFEKLFRHPPNLSKLQIFGCLCYPWLRPYSSNKLEPKSIPCVILEYSLTQNAYKCYDTKKLKNVDFKTCHFCGRCFPFWSSIIRSSPSRFEHNQLMDSLHFYSYISSPNLSHSCSPIKISTNSTFPKFFNFKNRSYTKSNTSNLAK